MNAQDVVWVLDVLQEHGLEVYVDGGWGVDALLGRTVLCRCCARSWGRLGFQKFHAVMLGNAILF